MMHVQQYLRVYTERPPDGPKLHTARPRRRTQQAEPSELEQAMWEVGRPWGGYVLTFDCETETDARSGQRLRFGLYRIHGVNADEQGQRYQAGSLDRAALDEVVEEGLFYDPAVLTPAEIELAHVWAAAQDSVCRRQGYPFRCLDATAFVRDVFYPWVYTAGALCVGHNLAYDLSRLAHRWGTIDRGPYNGGFWLTLCDCGHDECLSHPPVRIKHLGAHKNRLDFRAVSGRLPNGEKTGKTYRGKFVDTMTLGRALLGPGLMDLRGLGERAGVPSALLKERWDDTHGGPVTLEYLAYCHRDVGATWALYQHLRTLYRQHGISRPLWSIYSEASIGKGYLRDLGFPRFMQQHKDFPKAGHGRGMMAYHGGRSEVHIRQQPVEVIHCDFKSEYPTVNALMGLQELLLASSVTVQDCTADTRALLDSLTLERLQEPDTWRLLRRLVKVKPAGDILPVRSTFGDGPAATNIALPYVCGLPGWYTLADVIASALLTGRAPTILEALEMVAAGPAVPTQHWRLFGDERYTIDLSRQDFFTAVINLRTTVQADLDTAERGSAAWERLDSLQRALKLLANSTSYGVLVEMNQGERTARRQRLLCYDESVHRVSTAVLETPGPYFCGAIGTLIPAAGRLFLALCERLAADRGLTYAFCDTDSMAFARPPDMPREDFRQRVQEIIAYFTPLSPYEGTPPLLQIETVNLWQGQPEPLYCLGISAKRYVLYNRCADGTYRIRKFSSHGVGTWQKLKDYEPRTDIPAPCEDVYKLGGDRWMYDLWYAAIAHFEHLEQRSDGGEQIKKWERTVRLDGDWLDVPARSQVTISTRHLYEQFAAHFPALRPFNFITTLPGFFPTDIMQRLMPAWGDEHADVAAMTALYHGLDYQPFYESPEGTRRMDTHELVTIAPKTLRECLRGYYAHPEAKAACPMGVGTLDRLSVTVVEHVYCGKESNDVITELVDESEGVIPYPDVQTFGRRGLVAAVRAHGVDHVAAATPDAMQRRTLYKILAGDKPNAATTRRILACLDGCSPAHGCCATEHIAPMSSYEDRRHARSLMRRTCGARHKHTLHSHTEPADVGVLREALQAIPRGQLASCLGIPPRWISAALHSLGELSEQARHHLASITESWQADQIARDNAQYEAELQREMRRAYAQTKKAARYAIKAHDRIRQPRSEQYRTEYRQWVPRQFRNVRGGGLPLDIMLREMQQLRYYFGSDDLQEFSDWLYELVD